MLTPESITVSTPGSPTGGLDEQGNPIVGPATTSTVLIKGFAPRESEDSAEQFGSSTISGGTVYGYRNTVIPAEATLTIRGSLWHVDGEVGDWLSPYGATPQGITFAVKRAS